MTLNKFLMLIIILILPWSVSSVFSQEKQDHNHEIEHKVQDEHDHDNQHDCQCLFHSYSPSISLCHMPSHNPANGCNKGRKTACNNF
jgi:ABC-type nickel/cobalt efflux system permease component RcnA